MNQNEPCYECGDTKIDEDSVTGFLYCDSCGTHRGSSEDNRCSDGLSFGDNSQLNLTGRSDVRGRQKLGGAPMSRHDARKMGNVGLAREDSRAKHDRKQFKDNMLQEIRNLDLGKEVERAASMLIREAYDERKDLRESVRAKLGKCPLHQTRGIKGGAANAPKVAVLATLRAAVSFGLIDAFDWKPYVERWDLREKDIHTAKKNVMRWLRGLAAQCQLPFTINPVDRSARQRNVEAVMHDLLQLVRAHLTDMQGLARDVSLEAWRQADGMLTGDLEYENARADIIAATAVLDALDAYNIPGLNGAIARKAGLSQGGLTASRRRRGRSGKSMGEA